MRGASSRAFVAASLVVVAALAHAQAGSQQARDLLLRSMQPRSAHNVVAIIVQRDPAGEGSMQTVKVERARDGRVRHTILQPLRNAGIESIDDGQITRIYLPDRKLLIEQESAIRSAGDANWRMDLASRNYTFRTAGNTRIAGRTATAVIAQPRHPEIGVRRYYLDADTAYPLRMEVEEGGRRRVHFDTRDIRYPKELGDDLFQMRILTGVQRERYTKPPTAGNAGAAARLAGFQPIVPDELPLGFRIQEIELNDNPRWKCLKFRITDGLVRATVYQWRIDPRNVPVQAFEESSTLDIGGLRLMIVSDLGPRVRERILAGFAERLRRSQSEPAGTSGPPERADFAEGEPAARFSLLNRVDG
jgi:outer membrane lipoprotein-sorting protein